ncbi:UNVERIFIED_CONTAM: Adenosine 5'-monophosphoramidase [Siphonaria sp. JEL0065]|nr:Adenosine 5'-monophosphoramidase [Siphonaria sp. JEL0065]
MTSVAADCLFCKIVKGVIPCHKVAETATTLAFLDINPLSSGHTLVIPKYHAQFMHQLPDESLADLLPVAKKVALAQGPADNYNILQNNGRLAHQAVIPKPNKAEGLEISWPSKPTDHAAFAALAKELSEKVGKL